MNWETFTSIWGFNIATLFALLISALGVVFSWIKKRPRVRFAYNQVGTIIASHERSAFSEDIQILHNGSPIERATLTKFRCWNNGGEALRLTDVAEKDPLRVVCNNGARILQFRIEAETRKVNAVSLERSSGEDFINLQFEFLDPSDGFAIEVLHSGKPTDISITGTVIDSPMSPNRTEVFASSITIKWADVVESAAVILVPATSIFGFSDLLPDGGARTAMLIFWSLVTVLAVGNFLFRLHMMLHRPPKLLFPDLLD